MAAQAASRIREEAPQRAEYKPVLRLVDAPRRNGNRGLGRPRGATNILPRKIAEMVCEALIAAGGVEYLKRQAEENPKAFLALVAKLIPTKYSGGDTDEAATARPLPEIECWIIDTDGTRSEYGRRERG